MTLIYGICIWYIINIDVLFYECTLCAIIAGSNFTSQLSSLPAPCLDSQDIWNVIKFKCFSLKHSNEKSQSKVVRYNSVLARDSMQWFHDYLFLFLADVLFVSLQERSLPAPSIVLYVYTAVHCCKLLRHLETAVHFYHHCAAAAACRPGDNANALWMFQIRMGDSYLVSLDGEWIWINISAATPAAMPSYCWQL